MGKRRLEAIKAKFGSAGRQSKEYFRALDQATKLRFTSMDLEIKVLNGVPGTKGLLGNKRYKALSEEGKEKALVIVREECSRQLLWKPKELVGVAKRIEKRLKQEVN